MDSALPETMKTINRMLKLAAIWLLVIHTSSVCDAQAALAPSVRIMPLGDSITEGSEGLAPIQGGYRTKLYQLLTAAGFNVDFVGTLSDSNLNPDLPDRDERFLT